MVNDFIDKSNRRLIHVGPWSFYIRGIPSSKETSAISKLLCVPTSSARIQYEVKMPAIQTYLPPLQHNSIEMRYSFFATRYRIDKVKRFILPQKNREYADSAEYSGRG